MPQTYARLLSISVFAVLFGVVQVFCVCVMASATPLSANNAPGAQTHQQAAHHQTMPHTSESKQMPADGHGHDEGAACAHCDGDVSVATIVEFAPASLLSAPSSEKIALLGFKDSVQTRANMASTALAALRWLHPPTITPVTLKVLSLT